MIAINTVIKPMVGHEQEAIDNFYIFHESAHPDLFEFFKALVDQNLILNTIFWEPYVENNVHQLLRYYAVNMANAEIVQEKLSSESADLSLKKFWNQNKFDYSVELTEINFDEELPQYYLVDENTGGFWGDIWPLL
jgi:hypothetical protein